MRQQRSVAGVRHQDQEDLLGAYEALLCRSRKMLDSARAADWEELVDQESEYVVQVDRLQRRERDESALDEAGREYKAQLLECILEQDLEIRRHLVARREELGRMLGSSRQQLALSRAYGPQRGAAVTIDAEHRFTNRSS